MEKVVPMPPAKRSPHLPEETKGPPAAVEGDPASRPPPFTFPEPTSRSLAPIGWRSLLLYAVLPLSLLAAYGCTLLNSYILVPKQKLTFTPAKYRMAYQEVWFPAQDGVELNGWFLPGRPDQPLVLLFHGNAGNLSDNVEYLNLLHGCGFPLFIFDYRGFGKSQGEALKERDLYRDARGALTYLEQRGWSRDRIIFFGQSLGSAVALQMALEGPAAGLVMESSFTSMPDMVKHFSALAYYTVGWWSLNLPLDNLDKIALAQVPLLLIHGDRDPVVPVAMSQRLYAKAGAPKMLHIIRGGGHCNAYEVAPSAYIAAWRSYLTSVAAAREPVRTGRAWF